MRAWSLLAVAAAALAASCYPDSDKLRNSGGIVPPIGGIGGGIVPPIAGSGGGGGGTGGTGGTMPIPTQSRPQACMEWAAVMAAKGFRCSPLTLQRNQGTMASYMNRLQVLCAIFDVPGTTWPPRPFRPCADALAAQTCNDYLDDVIPPACIAMGIYAEGSSCGTGFQCQTDFCELPATGCGRCTRLPGNGQPCLRGNCAAGLVCNPGQLCTMPRVRGAPCAPDSPCRASLFCRSVCLPRGGPGTACTDDEECDYYQSALCNETRGQCVPATVSNMCRINADGSYVVCGQRGWCRMDGTCLPVAADNAACSTTDGPNCLWPAGCINSVCQLPQVNRSCTAGAVRDPAADPLGALGDLTPDQRAGGVRALFRSLVSGAP